MDYQKLFKVEPGTKVDLDKIDPRFTANHSNKVSAETEMAKYTRSLCDLQYLLYAENKKSLLICLQALDAGGKDGTINHVFTAFNPQGTRVYGFKIPTKEEAEHDFLWRVHKRVPGKGEVSIFNRSHYEDVLVVRVHNLAPKDVWSKRYEAIIDFEKDLADNGNKILKFYLHISPDEQLRRFEQRLNDPTRHWKISEYDYSERELWKEYMKAYEDALSKTSTKYAPWYIIPADRKWFRNLAISKIVAETMEGLNSKTPKPTVDIEEIRTKYHNAATEEKGDPHNKKAQKKDKGKKKKRAAQQEEQKLKDEKKKKKKEKKKEKKEEKKAAKENRGQNQDKG